MKARHQSVPHITTSHEQHRMGSLSIHLALFIFSTIANIITIATYSCPGNLEDFKDAMFDLQAYAHFFLIFMCFATIQFSYFAYCLGLIQNLFHIVNIVGIDIATCKGVERGIILIYVSTGLKILYTCYVLVVYKKDEYQETFHKYGSNISLYNANRARRYLTSLVQFSLLRLYLQILLIVYKESKDVTVGTHKYRAIFDAVFYICATHSIETGSNYTRFIALSATILSIAEGLYQTITVFVDSKRSHLELLQVKQTNLDISTVICGIL